MRRKIIIFVLVNMFLSFSGWPEIEEDQFDSYGGWRGLKGEETGWFHTEKINGRWWIVTPEGNVFWSVGVYCVRFGGLPEPGTGRRVYRETALKKYGSQKEWARVTKIQLKEWGFNTIGDWSSPSIYESPGLAYVIGIDLPRKAPSVIPKGSWGYFPDVFSEEFRKSVEEAMAKKFKAQPYLREDPWLLGYFLADEPAWYGSKQKRGALVDDFISLPPESPGKIAWVRFLEERYSDIQELNKSWGTDLNSFSELLKVKKIKDNDAVKKTKLDFLKLIARKFSRILYESLRRYDKNHMVLGTRPSRRYPEVIQAIGKYSDIFFMSAYNLNRGYTIEPDFSRIIEGVYERTGKPLMLGVLISAQDAGLPYGMVRTQQDRGISYWRYLQKVASNPLIVGLHWFQYFDPPLRCYDPRAANWGLVNQKDEPYMEAVSLISQANKMVYAYALGLAQFKPEFEREGGLKKETRPVQEQKVKRIALLLPDSGFEEGRSSWQFQVWKGKSKVFLDSSVKHSGRRSLRIQGGPDEGWDSVGVAVQYRPEFVLKPGFQYKLSGWIKTQNVEDGAFLRIKVKYKGGKTDYFQTKSLYGSGDWRYVKTEFSPWDENTVEYLDAQLVGRGIAWFDDISIQEISR